MNKMMTRKNNNLDSEMSEDLHIKIQKILYLYVCDKIDEFETLIRLNKNNVTMNVTGGWIGNRAQVTYNTIQYDIEV